MSDERREAIRYEDGSPGNSSAMPRRRYLIGVLGFVLAVAYFASGFYVVNAD